MNVVDQNTDFRESEVVSETKSVSIAETKQNQLQVDLEQLFKILQNYQDHPVAIVSVFGKFRTGKSFLLNILYQYLLNYHTPGWCKEKDVILKNVFHWKGGSQPDTTGVHITDKPIILENNKGQSIAVFLMDTQGCFEKSITATESSILFALSTLVSSVQIYNLPSGQIGEDNWQQLGVFCHYGSSSVDPTEQEAPTYAPFQSLMFLVRDWKTSDYNYGSKGGMEYFEEVMKAYTDEGKDVRKRIKESFVDVRCHLLPLPGEIVVNLKDSDVSNLELCDIDEGFLKGVDDLSKCLFSEDNWVVKQIDGEACTGKDIMSLAMELVKTMKSGKIPKVRTSMEMIKIVEFHKKIRKNEIEYETAMKNKVGDKYIDPTVLKQLHEECRDKALELFKTHDVIGVEESLYYRKQMEQNLDRTYEAFKHGNKAHKKMEIIAIKKRTSEAGNVYLKKMEEIAGRHYLEDVNTAKVLAERKALEVFKTSTSDCNQNLVQECENKLHEAIQFKHREFEWRNTGLLVREENKRFTDHLFEYYVTAFEGLEEIYVTEGELCQIHEDARLEVLTKFQNAKAGVPREDKEVYRESFKQLKKDIVQYFALVREKNSRNKNMIEEKLEVFYEMISEDYLRIMNEATNYVNDVFLNILHDKFKSKVIEEMEKEIPDPEIRQNAVTKFEEKIEEVKVGVDKARSLLEELIKVVPMTAQAGLAIGSKFGVVGRAVGALVGGIAGLTYVLLKNLIDSNKISVTNLPSIKYLKSISIK